MHLKEASENSIMLRFVVEAIWH